MFHKYIVSEKIKIHKKKSNKNAYVNVWLVTTYAFCSQPQKWLIINDLEI